MKLKGMIFQLAIFFFLINSSSALTAEFQEKMAFQYCNFSLNDPNFGAWDGSLGRGVFYNIENLKGDARNSYGQYNYKVYGQDVPRAFFNNNHFGGSSSVPIINVEEGKEVSIYSRCVLKDISDTSAIIVDYYPPSTGNLLMTSDFNLTTGILSKPSYYSMPKNIGDLSGSNYSYAFYGNSEYYFYLDKSGNNYIPIHTYHIKSDSFEFNGTYYYGHLNLPAISPGENILIESVSNLTGSRISGMYYGRALVYDNGGAAYYYSPAQISANSTPWFIFYVNSSIESNTGQQNLLSQAAYPIRSNENYFVQRNGINYSVSRGSNTLLYLFRPGDIIYWNITFSNQNPFSIQDRIAYYHLWSSASYGIGYNYPVSTDILSSNYSSIIEVDLGSFNAYQNKTFQFRYDYLDSNQYSLYPGITYLGYDIKNSSGNYFPIGIDRYGPVVLDGFPLVGIGSLGGKISLKDVDGQYLPVFSLVFELNGAWNYVNLSLLKNEDYYVLFKIFDSTTNEHVYEATSSFGSNQIFKNPNIEGVNPFTNLSYDFPVYDQNVFRPGHDYKLEAYTIYNGSSYNGKNWKDKRIATLTTGPKIDSGSSLYSSYNSIIVGPLAWPNIPSGESKELYIFNPTLKRLDLNLSINGISWSTTEGFRKHLYVCISSFSIINDYSDCDMIYRYDGNDPDKYISKNYKNIRPLEKKKLYLHIYCNDTGNIFSDTCGNSPNDEDYYGKIQFNLNYKDINEVNDKLEFEVYHSDGYCGDGGVLPGEECDLGYPSFGNSCDINNICGAVGTINECRCVPPINSSGVTASFWIYDDTGQITRGDIDVSKKIRMVSLVYGFEGALANDFKFNLFKNNNLLSDVFEGGKIDYLTGNPVGIKKANISTDAMYVTEFSQLEQNSFFDFLTNITYSGSAYFGEKSDKINLNCVPLNNVNECVGFDRIKCGLSCPVTYDGSNQVSCTQDGDNTLNLVTYGARCFWDEAKDACDYRMEYAGIDDSVVYGNYIFSSESAGQCVDGNKLINILGQFVPESGVNVICENKRDSVNVPCRTVAALPAFGYINFIVSLILVILLYFIFRKDLQKVY